MSITTRNKPDVTEIDASNYIYDKASGPVDCQASCQSIKLRNPLLIICQFYQTTGLYQWFLLLKNCMLIKYEKKKNNDYERINFHEEDDPRDKIFGPYFWVRIGISTFITLLIFLFVLFLERKKFIDCF